MVFADIDRSDATDKAIQHGALTGLANQVLSSGGGSKETAAQLIAELAKSGETPTGQGPTLPALIQIVAFLTYTCSVQHIYSGAPLSCGL